VSLDPSIAFLLVERLLGGSGGTEVPDRILTPLERVVVRIVTDRIVRELCSTWQDHVRMELQWSRFESAPELIEMAGRDDDVLVVRLDVGVGETKGAIRIALPFPVLEPFFSRGPVHRLTPTAVSAEEREGERSRVESLVRQASATISARLPSVRVPLRALSELRAGDVLDTGIPASSAVEVLVAGTRRFTAREGRLGPWVGIEIVGPWKPRGHAPRGNRLDGETRDGE
jgi:flagellar motor switch protein FliM